MGQRKAGNVGRLLISGLTVVLLAATLVWLTGCEPVDAPPDGPEEPTVADDVAEVEMGLASFEPAEITVAAGTTVIWVNDSGVEHTVTAGTRGNPTNLFDETVSTGDSFSYQFDEPGTYQYFCDIHPGMDGVVAVE